MDDVQLSLFDLLDEYEEITCPHCNGNFVLSYKSALDFEKVHGCYVMKREGITAAEFVKRWSKLNKE